jgi:hypothetical protein
VSVLPTDGRPGHQPALAKVLAKMGSVARRQRRRGWQHSLSDASLVALYGRGYPRPARRGGAAGRVARIIADAIRRECPDLTGVEVLELGCFDRARLPVVRPHSPQGKVPGRSAGGALGPPTDP